MREGTGTRDKYVVAYVPRGLRIDDHTSRAAARTASSLVFIGRHPVLLRRSRANCIVRTSPAQPRPAPAPPVQPYPTSSRPSSRHIASARARTVIASSLPTLYTEKAPDARCMPARISVMTTSQCAYDSDAYM